MKPCSFHITSISSPTVKQTVGGGSDWALNNRYALGAAAIKEESLESRNTMMMMMWNLCPTLGSVLMILSFSAMSVGAGTERRCLPVMETTWQQDDKGGNDGCSRMERQTPGGLDRGPLVQMFEWAGPVCILKFTFEQTLTGAAWCCSSPRTWWALWCCSARGTCSNTFGNEIHSEETSDIYHRRLASGTFSGPKKGERRGLNVNFSHVLKVQNCFQSIRYSQSYVSSAGRDLRPQPAALGQWQMWSLCSSPSAISYW